MSLLLPPTRLAAATLLALGGISQAVSPVGAQQRGPRPLELRGATSTASVFGIPTRRPVDVAFRTPQWRPGDPVREIPRRERGEQRPLRAPTRAHTGPDLLADLQRATSRSLADGFTSPERSFAGQGFTGAMPADPVGAAGRSHYVQAVNTVSGGTSVRVFDRQGSTLTTFLLSDLVPPSSSACSTAGGGDPIVLFDSLADRWLLSEFTWTDDRLCLYISQSADPLGTYWLYDFAAADFPDYPKLGVWPDGYYAGTNEADPALYVFERTAMLSGDPASMQRMALDFSDQLPGFAFEMLVPGGLAGQLAPPDGAPAVFVRHNDDELHYPGAADVDSDFVELFELSVDWDDSGNTLLFGPISIELTEFDSDLCDSNSGAGINPFRCILQPDSPRLDAVREILMFPAQYRNFGTHQSLVGSFAVDVADDDVAGTRWFELRDTGSGWELFQEGTYSELDGTSRWMSSIAMDQQGGIALGFNAANGDSSSDGYPVFPSLRFTGRTANAAPGTMDMAEVDLATGTASNSSERYGDYTSMSVGGSSDCWFWYTGQYNTSGTWSTWIASFAFDECAIIFRSDFETGDTTDWSGSTP